MRFIATVILPRNTKYIASTTKLMLIPFNTEYGWPISYGKPCQYVEDTQIYKIPYEFCGLPISEGKPCHCVGHEAWVEAEFKIRDEIKKARKKLGIDLSDDEIWAIEDYEWERLRIGPRKQRKIEIYEEHPLRFKPEADCWYCKGTGTYQGNHEDTGWFMWDWGSYGGSFWVKYNNSRVKLKGLVPVKYMYEPYLLPSVIVTPEGTWVDYDKEGWSTIPGNVNPILTWKEAIHKIYDYFNKHSAAYCFLHH